MRRLLLVLALALTAAGASGCKELHYYDIDVTFDLASFGSGGTISTIQTCHVYVTGAETFDFYIRNPGECQGNTLGASHLGTFEYSSTADAGELTFTMKAYNGLVEDTQCLYGEGSTTLSVGATTQTGKLNVLNNGLIGCVGM